MTTPHERRMRELEATRGVVADLTNLWESTSVGTVPATEVAAVFERHAKSLPPGSKILDQFERLASMIRKGPTRTRAEGIRQITMRLQQQAAQFAAVVEARDEKLRGK
jgi:hypothetical protein